MAIQGGDSREIHERFKECSSIESADGSRGISDQVKCMKAIDERIQPE